MKQDLSGLRQNYVKGQIDFNSLPENPMELFAVWYKEASSNKEIIEPNAMNLATKELDGYPRTRVVLLKEFNPEGFIFYTNYLSQKGLAIEQDPKVCLSFLWLELEQQVIIKGMSSKVAPHISEEYFYKRPVESQIGAIVSEQSSVIDFDADLEGVAEKMLVELRGENVAKPDSWGGYLVSPVEVEFWQGRPSRLHHRVRYVNQGGVWEKERLAP